MKEELKSQTFQLRKTTLKRLRKTAPDIEMTQQEIVDKAINAYLDAIEKTKQNENDK